MAPLAGLSVLLLPLAANAFAIPWSSKKTSYALKKEACQAFQDPSDDVVVDSYLAIEKSNSTTSRSSVFLENVRRSKNKRMLYNPIGHIFPRQTGTLDSALGGAEYLVDITVGSQNVKAILDTGSSDTWLAKAGFQCTDASKQVVDASQCNFGPLYNGDFIEQIPDVNFKISYGDGEFVTGEFGYQDVTIGGIKVPRQQIALGTSAYWQGDGISAGLVGLAYSAITSAYKGSNASSDSASTRVSYDPLFTTMYKQNLSAPTFSLAIQRSSASSGGYIAFGGLPPVTFDQNSFASTPIQVLSGNVGTGGYSFYTITPDALVFSGSGSKQSSQYIVDSGTTLNYFPSSTAKALNSLFSPKAASSNGLYTVNCNAKAPALAVKIGGKNFVINPKDLIIQDPSGVCVSGIQDGGSGPFILGDVFLNNVVAVFDVGAAQMRFAVHNY